MPASIVRREIAFYFPGHLWHRGDWIKTLLLFFDGIGLLVPEYKKGQPELVSPELAGPLRDANLLHYLVADQTVDRTATQEMTGIVDQLVTAGALNSLLGDSHTAFHAISRSRMGYFGDEKLAEALFKKLKAKGLARDTEDGVSIPLHPLVRVLILVLLAQILRPSGQLANDVLYPATDQAPLVSALVELLNLPLLSSTGHVVEFDLQSVTVDLSAVPLDEVLSFKSEHGAKHREYARSVRSFAHELSLMSTTERAIAFKDRQQQLDDMASDLRRSARTAWGKPASFFLSLAGAFWAAKTGNPFGALLSGGAAITGQLLGEKSNEGALSYIFGAQRRYGE